jgi:predicted transcriptional regulator
MTIDIVTEFLKRNDVTAETLPGLLRSVHAELRNAANGGAETVPRTSRVNGAAVNWTVGDDAARPVPKVPIHRSVGSDRITCLECGRDFQVLSRHLREAHGIDEDNYRSKWRLSSSYPFVAPSLSLRRSRAMREVKRRASARQAIDAARAQAKRTTSSATKVEAPKTAKAAETGAAMAVKASVAKAAWRKRAKKPKRGARGKTPRVKRRWGYRA